MDTERGTKIHECSKCGMVYWGGLSMKVTQCTECGAVRCDGEPTSNLEERIMMMKAAISIIFKHVSDDSVRYKIVGDFRRMFDKPEKCDG